MKAMQMIWLGLLILLITGIGAAQVPDLVGKWTGSTNGYVEGDVAYKLVEDENISLAIVEQKDRLFMGNITYMREGKEIVEGFAGAIGADNKTLYIAESKGHCFGTIISDDEIELIYLEDGETTVAAIDKLRRTEA